MRWTGVLNLTHPPIVPISSKWVNGKPAKKADRDRKISSPTTLAHEISEAKILGVVVPEGRSKNHKAAKCLVDKTHALKEREGDTNLE